MAKKLEEIKEEECPYELPEGWKWERLGNVTKRIKRGKSPKYTEKSNVLVFAQKCNQKSGEISLEKALFLDLEKLSKYKEDDFLYSKDIVINSTGTGTLGRVGFFDVPLLYDCERIVPDSHVTVIRASETILSECLYYYLKSKQTLLESLGEGSTNQKELKVATLGNLLIPIPSKETQQKIVDIIESLFAKLDVAQEKVEQVLAESENRRSAIIHNAFTGKMTEKWREENNVSFDTWQEIKLESLGNLERGCSKHRPRNDERLFGGIYPFIQTGDISNANVYIRSHNQTLSEFGLQQSKLFTKGTLCITIAANIGSVAILTYDCCFPDSVVGFTPNEKSDSKFMYYTISYMRNEIEINAPAVAQKNINLKMLNSLIINTPTVLEQKEIVRRLDKFLSVEDKVKTTCQNTLETIATMRKSILAKAFRGELSS